MKNKKLYSLLCLILACCAVAGLSGCAVSVKAGDLMEGISPNEISLTGDPLSQGAKVTDFAVRLFKESEESGKNTLISPLSVLSALAMTANGAKGETLSEMEAVLDMKTDELNEYIYAYMKALPSDEDGKLRLANSIWFTDDPRFGVKESFLQTNADYYGADAYKAPFNDQTCKDINNWVKDKTDGMIKDILDAIPAEALMYLVNALAFDAKWENKYEKGDIRDGDFKKEDYSVQKAEFMFSTEGVYIEDDIATGFMKYYEGKKYAFVALLPKKGVSVSEYVESLDGEALHAMLSAPEHLTVYASIPKFETEYSVEMSEILKNMGMPTAFDGGKADFRGLGTSSGGNISIGRVLHKTYISVSENGTKAGAATIVEMKDESCEMPTDIKEVYLDRPFVYMLVDCENDFPFFIGTVTDIEG